jgi:sulfite exporter TauE/SafE
MNLTLVFFTGLTTGALSCLAAQGGLLASSVAHQEELNIQARVATKSTKGSANQRRPDAAQMNSRQIQTGQQALAWPIFLFLAAKLVAYTILGFLLGWLGSLFQLTSFMQAIMQLAVGIFMVGTALRMLDVHPFFRHFVIEPPAFVTRYIRRTAKGGADTVSTPILLGALTVLIPCGVTQVMMASAIASGNPVQGAAILFAFTLGTSPLFFALAYLATQLGKKLERRFLQLVAATVLVLGLLSVNTALNLMGVPVLPSLTAARAVGEATPSVASSQPTSLPAANPAQEGLPSGWKVLSPADLGAESQAEEAAAGPAAGDQGNVITIQVLASAYMPDVAKGSSGQPTQLKLVTNNTWGCTRAFVIPSLGIQKILPETGETLIDLPPQPAGSTLFYTCSMGMYYGAIQF